MTEAEENTRRNHKFTVAMFRFDVSDSCRMRTEWNWGEQKELSYVIEITSASVAPRSSSAHEGEIINFER